MPKYRTYSIMIDGKMYQPKVTQNAVIETPFWFSPDITYTIQIYPYANGKGAVLAQGSFKSPGVTPPAPKLTIEEEGELLVEYLISAPSLPTRTVNSKENAKQVAAVGLAIKDLVLYKDYRSLISKDSVELLDQLPLTREELDNSEDDTTDITKYSSSNVKIYRGKEYASMKITLRDNATKEKLNLKGIFIKEDGVWKIDYIQTLKEMYVEFGLL